MKNKNSVRGLVILGIVLATWLVIVLAVPFVKNGAYWLSFVFTLIAFLAQLHIFKISFRNGESVRSKFYGFPIARLGVVYLAVQLVLGLLVMALAKWVPTWVGVILFAVTLAAAAVGCILPDDDSGLLLQLFQRDGLLLQFNLCLLMGDDFGQYIFHCFIY